MIEISDLSGIEASGVLDGRSISLFLIENKQTKEKPITVFNLNIDSSAARAIRLVAKNYIKELLATAQEVQKEPGKEENPIPDYNPDHSQVIFQIWKDAQDIKDALYFDSLVPFLSGKKVSIPFDTKQVKENKLKAWVIRFGYRVDGETKYIYFFQKFQASQLLKNKVSLWQVGGKFVLLSDSIYTMNDSMDFLLYEDTFVVTQMVAFEKLFGYETFYKQHAADLVTALNDNQIPGLDYKVVFRNLPHVKSKIQESTRVAHKLYSAQKNGYYKQIHFDKLEKLNDRYVLRLDLDATTKEWRVREDSNLYVVSQILNDDYGISQLTELEYLALFKERLQRPRPKPVTPPKLVTKSLQSKTAVPRPARRKPVKELVS